MQHQVNRVIEAEGQDDNWLDVSYTARKYSDQPTRNRTETVVKAKSKSAVKSVIQISVLLILCIGIMVGGMFMSDNSQWLTTAKNTVLTWLGSSEYSDDVSIDLPYNISVDSVTDGVVVFSGGRVVVSFTDGVVSSVADGSVSVTMNDDTVIVYNDLTQCYVEEGAVVASYDLIGKYENTATVSIFHEGNIVTNVVGSEMQLQWSV